VNDEFHFPTDGAGNVEDRNAVRDNQRLTAAAALAHEFLPHVRGELQFTALDSRGVDDDRPDSPADTVGFYYYDARNVVRRRALDGRIHVLPWAGSVITLGGEVLREAQRGHDSSNFSFERSRFAADRHNSALYGQWLADRGRVSVSVGARYDDNSTFGSFGTTRIGVAVGLWRNATVRGSAGTAFKAPTFFESFHTAFSTGNADLDPERSRHWELGIRQHVLDRRVELGATWFDQKFRDMIQYAFLSPEQPNYFNVAEASARGLELEALVRPASWVRLDGSVTLLRTRVDDPGLQSGESATFVEGNRLLRRPSVLAAGRLSVDVTTSTTADVLVTHTGSRDDRDFSTFPATPVVLPSWTRVDLAVTKSFVAAARFDVFGRIDNIFDRRYEEIANYPAARRSLTIGVRAASLRR
jgi:vitamin B12 transporter